VGSSVFYAVHANYYKQDQLAAVVKEPLQFSRCELLVLEAGSLGQGQFRNPEEVKHQLLEAATKQWK
jgi:hypothetical protein